MADLDERFRSLSRAPAPDLWSDIQGREPMELRDPSASRRAVAVVVAFVVAVAGIGLAALTFGGSEPGTVTGTSGTLGGATTNGSIYFRVGGGDAGSRIEAVESDGSERRIVFEGEPMRIAQIAWSPDGMKIAYQNPIIDERGIFVANSDGSDPVRLTEGANDAWPSWSPDGTKILFSSTRYDPSIPPCTPGLDFQCPTDIYVIDVDGSSITRLTSDPGPEYQPKWSPDGRQIAFVKAADEYAYTKIYTMTPDGGDVRRVSSSGGGSDFSPSWAPNSSQVVFAAIRNENWEIWIVNADGSAEHAVFSSGYVDSSVWSPDGDLIAFVAPSVDDDSPDDALYVMHPDGTGIRQLADAPGIGVAGEIAWQPIPAPPEATPEPTPTPAPTNAEVVGTFEVATDVRSVAFGEGSVWVAASNADGSFGGRIIRIDPETHEVQAVIAADGIPTWEVGGGAMVFADGDLWVAGDLERPGAYDDPGGGADAAVIRINASTNEVVQTISLDGTGAADLTFLDEDVWVLVFGDESVDYAMEVVRVDPVSGEVLGRVTLRARWAHTIVAAEGRLVVYEGGDEAVNVGGHLTSIDPETGALARAEIPSRYFEGGPVVWRGQVWAAAEDGFARFDPVTGEVVEGSTELDPSRFAFCCGFVEADDRGIWFIGFDGRTGGSERRLDVFDPSTGEVTELVDLDGDNSPVAMAVAPDGVWILNYEGTLTHVRLG